MKKNVPTDIQVTFYGQVEKVSPTLSKARARVFYKGFNRNGSYFPEKTVEEMLKTLPYTPVKGIYDDEFSKDFKGHGYDGSEGKIYGIVPESPNIEWEDHEDYDGVTRNYACADVLLFTGLYPEAAEIPGKSQSMELYPPSMEMELQLIDGRETVVITKAAFVGLQVLGGIVEPCFEGAAFYSYDNSQVESLEKKIQTLLDSYKNDEKGGLFTLNKYDINSLALYESLLKEINPEDGFTYSIVKTTNEGILAYNLTSTEYEWLVFEDDAFTVRSKDFYVLDDLTNEEYEKLKEARENFSQEEEEEEEVEGDDDKQVKDDPAEDEEEPTDFSAEVSALTQENAELKERIASLESNLEESKNFKLEIERGEKNQKLDQFAKLLDEEVLAKYRKTIDELSIEQLEKELAYELFKHNPSAYSSESQPIQVPKDKSDETNAWSILDRYK